MIAERVAERVLAYAKRMPTPSWDSFTVRFWRQGDVVGEAESLLASLVERKPDLCAACGASCPSDQKRHFCSVREGDTIYRWLQLCHECWSQAVAEFDLPDNGVVLEAIFTASPGTAYPFGPPGDLRWLARY